AFGSFVITRNDSSAALTIRMAIGGTAQNGIDYEAIADSVTLARGSNSTLLLIKPYDDTSPEGDETVTLTLLPGPAYTIAGNASATVTIHDSSPPVRPHLSPIEDLTMDEDTSSAPIPFTIEPPTLG